MKRADSYRFYLAASAANGFLFATATTVNLVYMVEVAHLDPLQMVLVGTVLELSVFLFEIPTGVVADTVGRRRSVVIGHLLTGVSFIVLVSWPSFGTILLAQVIWGVGWTFISGAYPAWLTDEIGVPRANQAFMSAAQLGQAASFFGIGAAIAFAHTSLRLPMFAAGLGYLALGVAMALLMEETGFQPRRDERNGWRQMAATVRAGTGEVRVKPLLAFILAFTVIYGMFSEGLDRLYTPYIIERFELPAIGPLGSVTWWGIIAAVGSLAALAATSIARRYVDTDDDRALALGLTVLTGGIGGAVIVFANIDLFLGVLAFYWLASALRAARGPLALAWVNRHIPSHARATMLSVYGQADSIGQVAGGPIVGFVAKQVSIGLALSVFAVVLIATLPLYAAAARRGEKTSAARCRQRDP